MSPDTRRALRNILLAVVVLALLADLAWLIHLLRSSATSEEKIALSVCGIIALFVLGEIAANVGRVVVKGPGGTEADMGDGNAS